MRHHAIFMTLILHNSVSLLFYLCNILNVCSKFAWQLDTNAANLADFSASTRILLLFLLSISSCCCYLIWLGNTWFPTSAFKVSAFLTCKFALVLLFCCFSKNPCRDDGLKSAMWLTLGRHTFTFLFFYYFLKVLSKMNVAPRVKTNKRKLTAASEMNEHKNKKNQSILKCDWMQITKMQKKSFVNLNVFQE